MKYSAILIILLSGILSHAQNGNIIVKIPAVKESKGNIIINLYNNNESFLDESECVKQIKIPAESYDIRHVISDIPIGNYAIHAYWDSNSNNKFDKNLIGIPKEAVGFSNNVLGSFGPPYFEDASFEVAEDIIIELIILVKKVSHF